MGGSRSCENRSINNKRPVTRISTENGDNNVLRETDRFTIDSVEFIRQGLNMDSIVLKNAAENYPCTLGYIQLKDDEIQQEFKFFGSQILYYKYKGDVSSLINDSVFATRFYKKIMDVDSSFYKMEQLHFSKIDTAKITDYGNCIVIRFKYITPTSANQDQPIIIFNTKKNEAITFNFSGMVIHNGILELNFKVREYKHAFYIAKYNNRIEKFVPYCYKIVTTE